MKNEIIDVEVITLIEVEVLVNSNGRRIVLGTQDAKLYYLDEKGRLSDINQDVARGIVTFLS
jgi:hypothetical protein